jgi:hypothetical protein
MTTTKKGELMGFDFESITGQVTGVTVLAGQVFVEVKPGPPFFYFALNAVATAWWAEMVFHAFRSKSPHPLQFWYSKGDPGPGQNIRHPFRPSEKISYFLVQALQETLT